MNDSSYKKLFITIKQESPTDHICTKVMCQIEHYRVIRARIYFTVHALITVVAIIGFIPAIQYIATESTNSGFLQYISLITSDSSVLMSNWKEFSLLIAESLPVIGSIACVGVLFVFTNSIYRSIKYIPRISIKKYA